MEAEKFFPASPYEIVLLPAFTATSAAATGTAATRSACATAIFSAKTRCVFLFNHNFHWVMPPFFISQEIFLEFEQKLKITNLD